jgi:sterol desaturase/sphingolipid hydroxylase (fatty acid hydroxylase superfamily)
LPNKRGGWLFAAIAFGTIAGLVWAERRRSLRQPAQLDGERTVTNLGLAGITAAATQAAMTPVVRPLTQWVERRRVGLVQRLPAPAWLRDALAVVLLDYTLYWWHLVEHRVPLLYRFHQVHHADLVLDTSTAARFHFGEFLASIPWRAGQVVLIGVAPRALAVWQRLTMLSVLFHHSNVCLPIGVECWLSRYVMTPRLHGIHHSIVADEQNSNWSSGLTVWDRLHGTYRANVLQRDITIGVPAYRDRDDVFSLPQSLAMPFRELPPWRLPDGTVPEHPPSPAPRDRLLP